MKGGIGCRSSIVIKFNILLVLFRELNEDEMQYTNRMNSVFAIFILMGPRRRGELYGVALS